MNIQFEITLECNLSCMNCDRSCNKEGLKKTIDHFKGNGLC